jgi:hypothetical protein
MTGEFMDQPHSDAPSNSAIRLSNQEFTDLVARLRRCVGRSELVGSMTCGTMLLPFGCGVMWLYGFHSSLILSGVGAATLVSVVSARLLKRQVRHFEHDIQALVQFLNNTDDAGLIGYILDLGKSTGTHYRTFEDVHSACYPAITRLLPLLKASYRVSSVVPEMV